MYDEEHDIYITVNFSSMRDSVIVGHTSGSFEMSVIRMDARKHYPPLSFSGYFTVSPVEPLHCDVYFDSITPSFSGKAVSHFTGGRKKYRSYKTYLQDVIKKVMLEFKGEEQVSVHDVLKIKHDQHISDRKYMTGILEGIGKIDNWDILKHDRHGGLARGQVILFMESIRDNFKENDDDNEARYKVGITFSKGRDGYYVFEGESLEKAWESLCNRDVDKYSFLPFYSPDSGEGVIIFKKVVEDPDNLMFIDMRRSMDSGRPVIVKGRRNKRRTLDG